MGLSTEFSRVNNTANLQRFRRHQSLQETKELINKKPTVSEISSMALIISGEEGIPDM